MNLTIVNTSATIDDASLAAAVAAIGLQVSRDFQPEWNIGATLGAARLSLGTAKAPIETPTDAIIYLGDESQDPTAGTAALYGYHSDNYNHIPYGFVYLDVCQQYGEVWSCTLSHEVLELLADPTAVVVIQGSAPQGVAAAAGLVYYNLEVCDPTQGDTYPINGITVANFVTKSYFGMLGGSHATNFLNLSLSPLGVRPGGYFQYANAGATGEINGSRVDGVRIAARKILAGHRRNARRASRLLAA